MRAEGDGGLERFRSPGKGRGLRALRPFQVGDLLLSCPAYASVLTVHERGNHCEHCFCRKEGLSKCGRCKQAFYCNVECQTPSGRLFPPQRDALGGEGRGREAGGRNRMESWRAAPSAEAAFVRAANVELTTGGQEDQGFPAEPL